MSADLGAKVRGLSEAVAAESLAMAGAVQSAGDGAIARLKGEIERQISGMEGLTATLITRTTALDGTILSQRDHLVDAAAGGGRRLPRHPAAAGR